MPQNVCSRCSSRVATADLFHPGRCVFPHSKSYSLKLMDVRIERCPRVSPHLPVNIYNSSLWLEGHYAPCRGSHVRCQNSEKFILFLFSSPRMTLPTVKSMKLYSPQKAFLILYVLYFYFHICIRYIFKILPRVLGRYLEMYSS